MGILLIKWRLTGSRDAAERMYEAIAGNIPNPTNEALWGAPGTMVGALHMFGWTGEERWRELCTRSGACGCIAALLDDGQCPPRPAGA